MEKILTPDQKREHDIMLSLKDNPARQMIVETLSDKLKSIESILNGDLRIMNSEDNTKVENLDEIKYSRNSLLRTERSVLKSIIEYPDIYIKNLGVYQTNKQP